MTNYSSGATTTAKEKKKTGDFWWNLVERATHNQYGDNVRFVRTQWTEKHIKEMPLEKLDEKPMAKPEEIGRRETDVNNKEYTNSGEMGEDETVFKVVNEVTYTKGNRYHYASTDGSGWNFGGNLGASVSPYGMGGINAGVSAGYNKSKSKTSGGEASSDHCVKLSYEQEERIKVPPRSKVRVNITSYSARYRQPYTIKFGADKNYYIPVTYKNSCQRLFCGHNVGRVNMEQLLKLLPGYQLEEDKATITIPFEVSWDSEGFNVEKWVEPMN